MSIFARVRLNRHHRPASPDHPSHFKARGRLSGGWACLRSIRTELTCRSLTFSGPEIHIYPVRVDSTPLLSLV
jgi:hypothetical protein